MRIFEALRALISFFEKHNIENPNADAEFILAEVLKCKRLELFLNFNRELSKKEIDELRSFSIRRSKHEPLQYIIGYVDFYDTKLNVNRNVLIPRPETEELIFQIKEYYLNEHNHIQSSLDLGTGSGAIAIAMAKMFNNIKVTAVDKSIEALKVAKTNAEFNEVTNNILFKESDWFSNICNCKFDIIISNPPYLSKQNFLSSQEEVRCYEPYCALVAKDNGLADLKEIIKNSKNYLNDNGALILEIGCDQYNELKIFSKSCGYKKTKSTLDLSKIQRYFWVFKE